MNKVYRSRETGSYYVYNRITGYKAKLYPFAFEKHDHKIINKLCKLMNAQDEADQRGDVETSDKLNPQIKRIQHLIRNIEDYRINSYIALLTGKDWALANEIVVEYDTQADINRAMIN